MVFCKVVAVNFEVVVRYGLMNRCQVIGEGLNWV